MADRSVTVRLGVDSSPFVAGMDKAEKSASAFHRTLDKDREALDMTVKGFTTVGIAASLGLGIVTKQALDWETAWAGVTKTVDGSSAQLADLESGLRQMARTMPATHTQIAAVAEAAGQLGVKTEGIKDFTRVMINLGETTNLSADEAATSLAQLMNVMQTAPADVERLGSAIVHLGNNGASTERDIVNMGQRIAAAGKSVGMSEHQVLSYASALASVGIEAEAGGSAISQSFLDISAATRKGGDDLKLIAKTAGMTAADFKKAWQDDAAGAMQRFVEGLGEMQTRGDDANGVLDKLGMTGLRQHDSLMRLAGAGDLLNASLRDGKQAWAENTALAAEAEKRYETTAAKIQIAFNAVTDAGINIGAQILPSIANAATVVSELATAFGELPPNVQGGVAQLGLFTAASSVTIAGMVKIVTSVNDAKLAFQNLGIASKVTLGIAGGIGAAVGLATIAVADWAQKQAESKGRIDSFTEAIASQNGVLGENVRKLAAKTLQDAGAFDAARQLGLGLDVVTDAALGNADAQAKVDAATRKAAEAWDIQSKSTEGNVRAASDAAIAAGENAKAADDLRGALGRTNDEITSAVERNYDMSEAMAFVRIEVENFGASLDALPEDVKTTLSTPGAQLSQEQVDLLNRTIGEVPGLTNARVLAPGARPSKDEVDAFVRSVGNVPGLTEANIRTMADLYGVQVAQTAIDRIKDKTVTIRTRYTTSGVQVAVADGGMFTTHAGRMVQAYASGGIHSIGAQQPQIRPAGGKGILWAEEGAGPWESFISGHPAKRARSRMIAGQTVRMLGGHVEWDRYADGGIRYTASPRTPPAFSQPSAAAPAGISPAALAQAVRDGLDGAQLRLGSVDPITHHVTAEVVSAARRL